MFAMAIMLLIAVQYIIPVIGSGHSAMTLLIVLLVLTAGIFFGVCYYAEKKKLPAKTRAYDRLDYEEKSQQPRFKFYKITLGLLFWAVVLCCFISCEYKWAQEETSTTQVSPTEWNADNIVLPHLTDRNQYVSNPDTILRQAVVDSMNVILRKLDTERNVESAVIVVNNVENADVFRMAQDVGNKYGVGHKETDRGLVIVVAYKDRKYFIAPGRGLEADLTDAECNQLARTYLTPFMKSFNPNGGMLALTEATYNLLNGKEMPDEPTDYQLSHGAQQEDEGDFEAFVFMLLFFWVMLYAHLDQKYRWLGLALLGGGTGFTGFGRDRAGTGSSWGSGWGGFGGGGFGRGGGFGGGGFGGGGGYGGGSFGGGGAGGGW